MASSLLTTGRLFASGTTAAVLVAMIRLLLTALRNASVSPSHEDGAMTQEVAAARAGWQQSTSPVVSPGCVRARRLPSMGPDDAVCPPAKHLCLAGGHTDGG
jgi:hypothetical protein